MASVTDAQILDRFRHAARQIANGDISTSQAREDLRRFLKDIGYQAENGLKGTIKDLSTEQRMNATLENTVTMAREWARRQRALQDPAHPGWRLYRAKAVEKPRKWDVRWQEAAERVGWEGVARDGSFVALVSSPIWEALSVFGHPYPPFDWGSQMRTRPVDYRTCEQLGLVGQDEDAAETLEPQIESLNANVEVTPRVAEGALRDELERMLKGVAHFEGKTLVLNDANGTRPYSWREIGEHIAGPLSPEAKAMGEEQLQKHAVELWCRNSPDLRGPVKMVEYIADDGTKQKRPYVSLDVREDMSRLVQRIIPVSSDDPDGGPIRRTLAFASLKDASFVLNRLRKDGEFSARDNSIGESWNNNDLTTNRFACKKINVILICKKYHSRRRIDGLYPYLKVDKQYNGINIATEGESIMPGNCLFGNAVLISEKKNALGGIDYVYEVEEI